MLFVVGAFVAACSTEGTEGSGQAGTGEGDSSGAVGSTSSTGDAPDSTAPDDESSTGPQASSTGPGTSSGAATGSTTAQGECVEHEPWLYASFDDVPVGESLGGNAPFNTAGRTVSSDAQSYAGGQSAQMEIRAGDAGGFGQWGGVVTLPDIAQGQSVWVRLWIYWPSDFEFSAQPWMKFIRLHERRADGGNGGYNDLYVDRADETQSVLRCIKEVHDVWEVYDGEPIARDTWERYEMQIVVDDVPVDDGGGARFRVWRDDALIFDRTDVPTVTGEGSVLDGLYLFTYWNNEMPPDNTAYIDELAVTFDDNPPPLTDDSGLPYFGDWLPCR